MAENIHIDLSEEIEQDLLQRYQSLCEELTQKLNSMESELEEICTQTQYEPMVNVVNETMALFNEEIYNLADIVFQEWQEGTGSFSAVVQNSQAGEAALETAHQIENNLREEFDTFWNSKPMGEMVQLDTSRPKIKGEDFDELKEIYTKYFQEIEDVNKENINQIIEQGEDNSTYNVIIPVVKAITEPIRNAFERFADKIDEAKQESESLKQQQDSNNDEASEIATQTSASIEDFADSVEMFKDI